MPEYRSLVMFNRICNLPWRKRHRAWLWWRQPPERGGWYWNCWYEFYVYKMVSIKKLTYSPVITTSGDWTQIFGIFVVRNFIFWGDGFAPPGYMPEIFPQSETSHINWYWACKSERKRFLSRIPMSSACQSQNIILVPIFGSFACNFVYLVAFGLIIDAFTRF